MEGRGITGWHKPSFNPAEADTLMSHNMAQLAASGNVYYVSIAGNDGPPNDGSSWDKAFRTIIHALSVAQDDDTILVGGGTFNETANGPGGVVVSQSRLLLESVGFTRIVNADLNDGGVVIEITGSDNTIKGFSLLKGESFSDNAIIVRFNGGINNVFADSGILLEKSNFTGIQFTGGVQTSVFGVPTRSQNAIASTVGGIGVNFDNCTSCLIESLIIFGCSVGVLCTGATSFVNGIDDRSDISNCFIGAQINSGAIGNIFNSRFTNCTTDIVDNSGNATNYRFGSFTHLHDDISFIPKHPGNIWFVDGSGGLDTNTGHSPIEALQTITAAVTAASPGDAISILPGTYDEAVNLNKAALQLWPQLGVILTNTTPGTPLAISANNCVIQQGGLIISQAGQIGIAVTGLGCRLEEIIVQAATTAIDINGAGTILLRGYVSGHTVTALDISSSGCIIEDFYAIGNGSSTRGIYLSSSGSDDNVLNRCVSAGNATAGFEAVSGTRDNVIKDSSSGNGDGSPVDSGLNSWPSFHWIDTTEEHEDLWPIFLGQGVAAGPVTIDNIATDDTPDSRSTQDYWGDTVAIVAPNAITKRWLSNGVDVFSGVANKIMVFEFYYPQIAFSTTRNGGNAWDLGETVLTVTDGSVPQINDKIWIASNSHPNGEILLVSNVVGNVVTVASETRASGNTGIRYNHVGSETMYIIERSGLSRLDGHQGSYSAPNTKESATRKWKQKDLPPNAGMIARLANVDDNLPASIDTKIIYGD